MHLRFCSSRALPTTTTPPSSRSSSPEATDTGTVPTFPNWVRHGQVTALPHSSGRAKSQLREREENQGDAGSGDQAVYKTP